jgi:hypothetical protein
MASADAWFALGCLIGGFALVTAVLMILWPW